MTSPLHCPGDERSRLVRDSSVNGIDHLEVLASQRTLLVHCFDPVPELDADNVVVEGGERVRDVAVEWAAPASAPLDRLRGDEQAYVAAIGAERRARALLVRTDRAGDFSTYVLRLVASRALAERPPVGFDLVRSQVAFSFKVDCPSEFDCLDTPRCDPPQLASPQIDYLARDYASLRRLVLDRLAVVMPGWRERNPADAIVTLVEVLAYAGDQLSYYQDAVATEAYLGTARRRASVRRHARLVDYRMHDGANARTWTCFEVEEAHDGRRLEPGTTVLTGEAGMPVTLAVEDVPAAVSRGALAFETLEPVVLRHARNAISLHTWGDPDCCLPTGSTRATLRGTPDLLRLDRGDVLVLEEVRGAETGLGVDADPAHRHAVRLSRRPVALHDEVLDVPVIDVEWHAEDALPFPLCLRDHGAGRETSVVRGNVALCDHGHRVGPEPLPTPIEGRRYRPPLQRAGLTQALPYEAERARRRPASDATRSDPAGALPWIFLIGDGERWEPERELLNSDRFATSFVAEMREDGRAELRFGDDLLGRAPEPGATLSAHYRVGNGTHGNIGAGALARVAVSQPLRLIRVRNPLPASGGADPEPIDHGRLYAPQMFRSQRRAVTVEDYVAAAQRHPEVQRAGATRRWTGSWWTVFLTIDRRGGRPIDAAFEAQLRGFLDPLRLAGHDIEIDAPRFVALELAMQVCVAAGYVRVNVEQALLERLRAFFHPDNFTFGQTVHLSPIVAAAMAVPGVEWVQTTALHRFREPNGEPLETGRLTLARLEIARLDNDPNRPENGRIQLDMQGGT